MYMGQLKIQCLNVFSLPFNGKENELRQNFELFLHMLLKFEIIWTRIVQNDINLSETPWTSQMKSFLKHPCIYKLGNMTERWKPNCWN